MQESDGDPSQEYWRLGCSCQTNVSLVRAEQGINGNSIPRSSLWHTDGVEVSGVYSGCRDYSRARHWRKHSRVLDREWCVIEPAILPARRSVSRIRREQGQFRKRVDLVSELSRLEEGQSFVLLDGGLARFFLQPDRRGRARANRW